MNQRFLTLYDLKGYPWMLEEVKAEYEKQEAAYRIITIHDKLDVLSEIKALQPEIACVLVYPEKMTRGMLTAVLKELRKQDRETMVISNNLKLLRDASPEDHTLLMESCSFYGEEDRGFYQTFVSRE
ncbi:hypothetical protein [Listeria newyorkensis]|uniref:hypothetical protein n=1 Tax=Listeria newyorkensis TaxID=1497681 RepID=UPI0010F76681|nr:hypothetical protein [Listeria newyorkensis]